jgi:hypothetical protein
VREIRSLGSMKRDVETESWNLDCGTANRKGRKQLRGTYRHRATSRLYDRLKSEIPELKPTRAEQRMTNLRGEREEADVAPSPHILSRKSA